MHTRTAFLFSSPSRSCVICLKTKQPHDAPVFHPKKQNSPIDPLGRLGDEQTQREQHVAVADLLGVHTVDGIHTPYGRHASCALRVILAVFAEN